MKQIATVRELVDESRALVDVARQTACGHDCENCSGCGAQGGVLTVSAKTDVPVVPGDKVELYSDNRVLGFAALVYLCPVFLFLLGYLISSGIPEGYRYLLGGVGFALGLLAAVIFDRVIRRKNFSYTIVRKL